MIVKNYYTGNKVNNLERRINFLLRYVSREEISGLNSIVLVDKIYPIKKNILGRYHVGDKTQLPRIELAIESIFEDVPSIVCYFPFFVNFFIGRILYHEIGHHFQTANFNLKKKNWEGFAEEYSHKQLKKTFFWLNIALAPIRLVLKTFKKIKK